jgi:hypothetical protein
MKRYPKTIYVKQIKDSDDTFYLLAEEDIANDGLGDGIIGVYELKETKTRRTEIHLE